MSTAIDTLVLGAMTHSLAKASHREMYNLRTLHGTYIHQVEREQALSWLSSINFEAKQRDTLEKRHEDTASGILGLASFQDWYTLGPSTLSYMRGGNEVSSIMVKESIKINRRYCLYYKNSTRLMLRSRGTIYLRY